jgi:hypothetical protein
MALMGFVHGHGHHGHDAHQGHAHGVDVHTGHAHAGHGHAGHADAGHGHAHASSHTHGAAAGHTGHDDGSGGDGDVDAQGAGNLAALLWIMPFLSPLNWFSWMIGAGAAGSLAGAVAEPGRAAIAVAGAIGFNLLVVKPLWSFIFGFASQPAKNLEGCLMQQVEAVTGFDERGEGLIRVTIDGHSEDVLARLIDGERGIVRIRRGDRLLIEEVDPRTNSCRVSRV